MYVKDAIKKLSLYDGNDEIIIAWWDEELSPIDTEEIPWVDQVSIAEEEMDWSRTHEGLAEYIYQNSDGYFEDKQTEEVRDNVN